MANFKILPEGYEKIFEVNLVENKIMMLVLNGIAVAIAVVMVVLMSMIIPFSSMLFTANGVFDPVLRLITLAVGCLAYIFLHEFIHGVFIKKYSGEKAKYGFKGGCAYAGSDAYFDKRSYIIIALAPVVIWGIILLILNLIVPLEWFWVVYIIQILNVSGAVGDLYVTWKFSKFPDDILVTDSGVAMEVYSKQYK